QSPQLVRAPLRKRAQVRVDHVAATVLAVDDLDVLGAVGRLHQRRAGTVFAGGVGGGGDVVAVAPVGQRGDADADAGQDDDGRGCGEPPSCGRRTAQRDDAVGFRSTGGRRVE